MDNNKIINDAYIELNQDGIISKMFYDFNFIQNIERGGEIYRQIFFILCNSELFNKHSEEALKFSSKGLELTRDFKTYYEYLDFLKDEKERKELRELEAHTANLTASKAAVSSKKSSWASTGIAAITTLFGIFQYFKSNEISDKYDKVVIQIDSLKQDLKEMKLHKQDLADSSKTQQKKK